LGLIYKDANLSQRVAWDKKFLLRYWFLGNKFSVGRKRGTLVLKNRKFLNLILIG
jgi:hypothetical protein